MQNDDKTQPLPNKPTPQPDDVQYNQKGFSAGQNTIPYPPEPATPPQYSQKAFLAGQNTIPYPPEPATPPQYNQVAFQADYLPPNPGPSGQAPAAAPTPKGRMRLLIMGAGGAIILLFLVMGGFLFLPGGVMAKNNNQAATVATATTMLPVTPAASKNIYTPYLTQYGPAIRTQIAQGLKLSSDQLTTQLRAKQTLSQIATKQGVSSTQLQTLVTSTFQSNFQPAIANGNLTQKQVTALIKRMTKQSKTLDLYLAASPKANGATTTPTPAS